MKIDKVTYSLMERNSLCIEGKANVQFLHFSIDLCLGAMTASTRIEDIVPSYTISIHRMVPLERLERNLTLT